MPHRLALVLATTTFLLAGCNGKEHSSPSTTPPSAAVQTKPSFVPPTAEEAYRLQDDCSQRGAAVLRTNVIGSALTQEQVSRYNPTTNRCYVRLEVRPLVLNDANQFQLHTVLYDGQTREFL